MGGDGNIVIPGLPEPVYGESMVGLGRFELPTSPLSGVRSNQLSYRPGTGDYTLYSGVSTFF